MTQVELGENEVVLYEAEVTAKKEDFSSAAMTLTNERLIFQYKKRIKLFQKEMVETSYNVADIKVYNDVPQLKIKENSVEIFLKNKQMCLVMYTRKDAKKFQEAVMELFTGRNKITRTAEKIKSGINLVNDTLGCDTVSAASEIVSVGGVGAIKALLGKGKIVNKIVGAVSKIGESTGKAVQHNKIETPKLAEKEKTLDDKIEQVKKYKELWDAGIINEEEFTAKKKEILGV